MQLPLRPCTCPSRPARKIKTSMPATATATTHDIAANTSRHINMSRMPRHKASAEPCPHDELLDDELEDELELLDDELWLDEDELELLDDELDEDELDDDELLLDLHTPMVSRC